MVTLDGEKIRELREEHLWLIGDLAQASGVDRSTISNLEHGHRQAHPDTVRKLADALAVPPRDLVVKSKKTRRSRGVASRGV